MIVPFPRHKLHGRWCCDGGTADNCVLCVLSYCPTCGGGEASLPTHCPGRRMSLQEEDLIQQGKLDFDFRFGWTEK